MTIGIQQELIETLSKDGLTPDCCSNAALCRALLRILRQRQEHLPATVGKRKVYYFSSEFLVGRLLRSELINLGLLEEVEELLARYGRSFAEVEDAETEPSLGNGGLGRLAACFMDSIASCGLAGDGVSLCYHYGLFHQDLAMGRQQEYPEPWLTPDGCLIDTGERFTVQMADFALTAHLWDLPVTGYENGVCNRLHLFDVEQEPEKPNHGITFDKTDIARNLTAFLYPDDSDEAGRLLRIYQQYFMVSAGAQMILRDVERAGHPLQELDRYAVIHINDTHPSMVIPEMVRLLMQRGLSDCEAIAVVERSCAYTNHTILAEALETWPASQIAKVAPQLLPIIRLLSDHAAERCDKPQLAIWDEKDVIHMAHLDIHFSRSVNGVAALHTQILQQSELKDFYALYPEKFNNKTNGITFRRWLMGCNEPLSDLLSERIGDGWKKDPALLEQLLAFADDAAVLERLGAVKQENKRAFCRYMAEKQGVQIDPNSIIDVQIKRFHQYKRQQMNALYAIWKYLQIKSGHLPARPITMIWGGKAAPAYTLAKDTIHLILCLQKWIESDAQVSPWLRLVVVENYNVTAAEHIIPACDVSEQISLASKEASGTGNMKLMANGAVTLGTMDGANVEIAELVGADNIYIFGRRSQEVIALYAADGYRPADYLRSAKVHELVEFIRSPELLALGDAESLLRVYHDLCEKDYFMTLLDLEEYIAVKECCFADYEDRTAWHRKMLVNIARSGFFSSDRTIAEYERDIWHLA